MLAFARGHLTVVLNAAATPMPLPPGDVLIASGPLDGDTLPGDTAVWLV